MTNSVTPELDDWEVESLKPPLKAVGAGGEFAEVEWLLGISIFLLVLSCVYSFWAMFIRSSPAAAEERQVTISRSKSPHPNPRRSLRTKKKKKKRMSETDVLVKQ